MSSSKRLGDAAEELVADRLQESGWRILERKYRCRRFGEIDIIAMDGEELVFVEVKCRRSAAFGSPLEAVDGRKAARIRLVAESYLQAMPASRERAVRFDVVSVTFQGGRPVIGHLRGAF